MTSRELVVKTLNHEPTPRVPRDLWVPFGEDSVFADDLAEMNVRYPSDIAPIEAGPLQVKKAAAKPGKAGDFTDAWGCVWHRESADAALQLKLSPLAEAGKIAAFQPPADLLDKSRFAKVNKFCHSTNRFALAWSDVRLFDRLRFLRGESTLVDLARGTKDIRHLLATLNELACKEISLWADTDVDGVVFRDDWGNDEELLVSTEMWREMFRPLYKEYCRILHEKDKFVFFISNGNIYDIFGDLIKLGVDAIHSEWRLMDVERLAKRFRGRVTFWGEMDGQRLQNPGTVDEFRQSVLAVRKALDFGAGGAIAQCQWTPGIKVNTIATFFEQWLVPLSMRA
jgi:uroporphyrinogen decarboxylase